MTINETISKLASKEAQLIEKQADCTVLRNQIAELKRQLKVLKERERDAKKPVAKPTATGRNRSKKDGKGI